MDSPRNPVILLVAKDILLVAKDILLVARDIPLAAKDILLVTLSLNIPLQEVRDTHSLDHPKWAILSPDLVLSQVNNLNLKFISQERLVIMCVNYFHYYY